MDSYLGEIRILPYTFAPAGWALEMLRERMT